jgi:hypothetical protein
MAEGKKRQVTLGGVTVEVTQIEIVDRRHEQPNEYELADGSIIRVTNPTTVVYRIEGPKDLEGNPAYYVKNGTSVTVVQGPRQEELKNGGSS